MRHQQKYKARMLRKPKRKSKHKASYLRKRTCADFTFFLILSISTLFDDSNEVKRNNEIKT